jgi:hypothetical protein
MILHESLKNHEMSIGGEKADILRSDQGLHVTSSGTGHNCMPKRENKGSRK